MREFDLYSKILLTYLLSVYF